MRNFTIRTAAIAALLFACAPRGQASESRGASEPFGAALLGLLPVASGYYATEKPHLGVFFTALDVTLIAAAWNAQNSEMQSDENTPVYLALLAVSNIADLFLSYRQAQADSRIRLVPTAGPDGEQGLEAHWSF